MMFNLEKITEGRQRFAAKVIRARDIEYQKVALKEYNLLRSLNHPGIIKMNDAFINNSKATIYLVMDLVEGESLKQFVETYTNNPQNEKSVLGGLPERMCKSISY